MRKELQKILDSIDVHERLREMANEMQEKFDGRSEKWQESEAGEAMQEKIGALESIADNLENAVGELASFIEVD